MTGGDIAVGGGARVATVALEVLRLAMRAVFRVPPAALLILALGAAALVVVVAPPLGWPAILVGVLVAALAMLGLLRWWWAIRGAGDRFVVLISEFSERGVHSGIRVANIHREELVEKVRARAAVGGALEIRTLPPVSISTADRVLRRSSAWAVVRGETVTAGQHVKWSASIVYRVLAHSRRAATLDGQPAMSLGEEAWTPLSRLVLPVDAQQPISVLTADDFPASHAEGTVAMLLALQACQLHTPEELRAAVKAIRDRWEHAPSPAKALAVAAQAEEALATEGWPACLQTLQRAIRREGIDDPLLLHLYAGYVSIACAHGMESVATWLDAVSAIDQSDPNMAYLTACARMAAGRWEDALDLLAEISTERFKGPLGPDRREVLSAYFQAADLAGDDDQAWLALRRLRSAMRRRLRRPPSTAMYVLGWLQVHNYDHHGLSRFQRRLDDLGRQLDIEALRESVAARRG